MAAIARVTARFLTSTSEKLHAGLETGGGHRAGAADRAVQTLEAYRATL